MSVVHNDPCRCEAEPATLEYVAGLVTLPVAMMAVTYWSIGSGWIPERIAWFLLGGIACSLWQILVHDPHINAWLIERGGP